MIMELWLAQGESGAAYWFPQKPVRSPPDGWVSGDGPISTMRIFQQFTGVKGGLLKLYITDTPPYESPAKEEKPDEGVSVRGLLEVDCDIRMTSPAYVRLVVEDCAIHIPIKEVEEALKQVRQKQ